MAISPAVHEKGAHPIVDASGYFRRQPSQFRNFVKADPDAMFPAEKNRYALYIHPGCPWAHRANLTRSLKGLEDVVQLIPLDSMDPVKGWFFSGTRAGPERDPLYGAKYLREIYLRADPNYTGRVTVPMLWDKKTETVVSNESSEIIRMFYESFDEFVPEELREAKKGEGALFPPHLQKEIEELNEWVYDTINNGVYKTGYATTQAAYEEHIYPLFKSLDKLEKHLSEPGHSPYLFGEHITDADIRLFPTLVRFDAAYHTTFKCNLKMIRHDYPRLHDWLRRLYWNERAFRDTTYFDIIKRGYARTMQSGIIPAGPLPNILPLEA
ncbi:transferase [Rhizodiscina lignyota]|uniref:Transferase n=1 Tax=Rhizodiscina lignyota TaxID=1504668 RepID=A0A9P4IBG1_9PEZI|nr:transferase [Rhizodiscina lignyota]